MDAHLAQLGMAIEIINHEFSGTIRAIRNGLRRLKAWADANDGLGELYNSIRTSFEHLDGYLTLFTPLQRRLYRKEVEIRGTEVRNFLQDLFKARLARHETKLTATRNFGSAKIVSFPSSIYPIFVNLVDNSIFWLSQQNPKSNEKSYCASATVRCSFQTQDLCIDERDQEAMFEFGFTRKPGGRGMGLHIGRESLRRVGFDLRFFDDQFSGATFGIVPMKEY